MNWWQYLLLVNIYLSLFFGFYTILLRRETFFQLNRVYLISAAILSFFIPLIQSDWVRDLFITQQVQHTIYGGTTIDITDIAPIKDNPITIGQVLVVLYAIGVVCLAVRLILQLFVLRKLINDPSPSVAYSFFNKIKVNPEVDGKDVIESHEMVHARQFHSADVLIIETVMIINWFNPVVYLYRMAIKHVHEYIADSHTLKAGADKTQYAMLLLSQSFNTQAHTLANPFFNNSLLKKRIIMLQKNKSQRIKLIKYGLSAPLFILMLVLSSATINNSKAMKKIQNTAENVFLSPANNVLSDTASKETIVTYDPKTDQHVIVLDTVPEINKQLFTAVENPPTFPGGENAFTRFLSENIKYPEEAKKNNVQGRCLLTFVVERDGALSDIKVIRPVGSGIDEEAVRVLSISPKWKPGVQNGRAVRVQYAVPVNFSLNNKNLPVPNNADNEPVFSEVENVPTFPGGENAFAKFLALNVKYPKAAKDGKIQGRVIATFTVEKDGSLAGIKVLRGPGSGLNEEAVRVLELSPKWKPGMQNGHVVRVTYTVPINFSLADEQTDNKTGSIKSISKTEAAIAATDTVLKINIIGKNDGEPTYYVNGVQKASVDIKKLDPKDIEKIEVLKTQTAKILYGKQADNGVILITTKAKKGYKFQ